MLVCKKALNGFVRQKWPDHSLADIRFSSNKRKQLAKVAIYITIVK